MSSFLTCVDCLSSVVCVVLGDATSLLVLALGPPICMLCLLHWYSSLRASPVVPGSASASRNEKWPPSRMQMQTQENLPLILLSTFWLDLEMVGFYH